MNLRQVIFWLIAIFSLAFTFSSVAQQVQIKGPKGSDPQLSDLTYGPITPSDTLWQIASRYRQNKQLSVYQVMQAIYELNPEAFENNNFNLIKDGSILNLPSESYVARINADQAKLRAEQDDEAFQPGQSGASGSAVAVSVKSPPEVASKEDLTQTKQVLEDKLTAIDQEQNRQFQAIRQQFSESINSVQSLLDKNQALYDRLDAVNQDIEGLRSRVDDEIQAQMDQMLALQNELLSISKEAEVQRQAEAEKSSMAWLGAPITLLVGSVLITLVGLGFFAKWLINKRSTPAQTPEPELQATVAAPIVEQSTEMDELADALTEELSGELDDEDEDDLFGEDDLLDDVLSEELQESLDEALDEEMDSFDDLDDEMLVPETDKPEDDLFEDGAVELEQGDLDTLFADDQDDLLAEIDEGEDAIELSDTETDAPGSEEAEPDTLLDEGSQAEEQDLAELDEDLVDLAETEPVSEQTGQVPKAQEEPLPAVDDESEKPEISIDELLEEPESALPESIASDSEEVISEETLQKLDKEIASQNEELDKITDELLGEVEQLEQMGLISDQDLSADEQTSDDIEAAGSQHDIQVLDQLSDQLSNELDDADAPFETDEALLDDVPDIEADDAPLGSDASSEPELQPETAPSDLNEASIPENVAEDLEDPLTNELLNELEAAVDLEPNVETEQHIASKQAAGADQLSEQEDHTQVSEDTLLDESQTKAEVAGDSLQNADFEDPIAEQKQVNEPSGDTLEAEAEALPVEVDEFEQALAEFDVSEADVPDTQTDTGLDNGDEKTAELEQSLPGLDDIGALDEELEDSDLEQALDSFDGHDLESLVDDSVSLPEVDELEDMPGLGDWLSDPDTKESEDLSALEALESTDFDELLESIDEVDNKPNNPQSDELDNPDLDLEALLNERVDDAELDAALSEQADREDEDNFLDVDALLNESIQAESEPVTEKKLDLDISLEDYTGVTNDEDIIDVDSDQGMGAKLDLARAYLEIDDQTSAKELLQEVIDKGGADQQSEAKQIMQRLGE